MGIAFIGSGAPKAQSAETGYTPPVTRVEEDWTLVLNEPDNNTDSPQFHTVMSPFGDVDSYYGQVLWNYRELPDFAAGGLQLNAWEGETIIRRRAIRTEQLSTTAETVTWTQALSTDGVTLTFQVFHGQSVTWGYFNRDMRIDSAAYLSDLSQYSTDTTVENSCITYGSNRADALMITQVRYYDAGGNLLAVDSTPRVVCGLEE